MSRIRLILLSMLAVFAVSAVSSASASAAECKKEANKKFVLCIGEPLLLVEGEFNIDVSSIGKTVLHNGVVTISCEKILPVLVLLDALAGEITILPFVLHFVECSVTLGVHCVLKESLILTLKLVGKVNGKGEIEFYPETGTHFATIEIASSGGTCVSAGKQEVVAKEGHEKEGPLCEVPEAEVTKKLHLIECGKKSSMLKFAGKEATFEGKFDTILLLSGVEDSWDIIEGT